MSPAGEVRVSAILCVRNGAGTIVRQLEALGAQQTELAWELVVVDNGSTDGSRGLVEAWGAAHPALALTVIDGSHVRGVAAARNVGAAATRGALLLFCDADDEADPRWIDELAGALGEADMAGGHVELDRLNAPETRSWQRGRIPDTTSGLPQLGLPAEGAGIPFAIGANMGITAAAWRRIGGCDPNLLGAWEEIDLCVRAHLAGCRLVFAPAAVMHYRLRDGLGAAVRQARHYGRGEADFRLKHGGPPLIERMSWRTEGRAVLRLGRAGLRRLAGGREERREWLQWAAYKWGLWTGMLNGWRRRRRLRAPSPGGSDADIDSARWG